jgi:hypothetical protein
MKKVLGILTVFICLSSISANAQGGGGGGQQMDPAARAAMMKERYKALGCNDVQGDSVMAITNDFRPKMMALRDLEQDARAEKMKEINEERNKRLEKALPAELAKKVIEAMSQQRGGGGRGPNQ